MQRAAWVSLKPLTYFITQAKLLVANILRSLIKRSLKKRSKRFSKITLLARYNFNSIKVADLFYWWISLTWMCLDIKKKWMLELKRHLLSPSVHLLQWFSASLLSSTPLWTTLSKFTMGRLNIPVFSAPSPVHTQVRANKISFWCNY